MGTALSRKTFLAKGVSGTQEGSRGGFPGPENCPMLCALGSLGTLEFLAEIFF